MKIVKLFRILALTLGLILTIVFVKGATITSTSNGGNWGSPGTWTGGVVPINTDLVIIASTASHEVTLDNNYTCAAITINTGSKLFISIFTLTLNGNLTNNGTLDGSSGLLRIGSNTIGSLGEFSAGKGTVEYNGSTSQTVPAIAFYNLVLSGRDVKILSSGTSIAGNLQILRGYSPYTIASIAAGINIFVGSLTLDLSFKNSGTWGSTSSNATNKDNNYFAATTGYITINAPLSPSINAGGSGNVCLGSDLTLSSSGTNIFNQYWQGPNGFYSIEQNPSLPGSTTAMAGTYFVTGSAIIGPNLVNNGDFEAGIIGFLTAYTYNVSDLTIERSITVTVDPHSVCNQFASCSDHTPSGTKQLVVNGSTTPNNNDAIWKESISVVINTDYQFSYWVQSVNSASPAKIQLKINGAPIIPLNNALAGPGLWTQFIFNWNSSTATTAIIELIDKITAQDGNDFALDDIVFQQVNTNVSSVNVTVNPSSVGGNVSGGGGTILFGTKPSDITLNGNTGTVIKWQKSSDGVSYSDIHVTTTTLTGATIGNLTATTHFRALVQSGACSQAYSDPVLVNVTSDLTWNGSISTDWNIAGNWNPTFVPTSDASCQIPAGNLRYPLLSTQVEIKDLKIKIGATVTLGGTATLTISDSLINNAGNSGLIISSTTTATGSILYAKSDIVPATVQRNITGDSVAWHFMSSPVTAQGISGAWLPSGTYSNDTGYDLYLWNEPTNCWIYYKADSVSIWNAANPNHNFVPGRGYLYSLQVPNATNQFAGNLNSGSISYGLKNQSVLSSLKGFNLVGNPYPSSIDWHVTSGWNRTNLVPSGGGYDMWIWNPAFNNYGVYNSADNSGNGTNGITRFIAPMQGYFVRAINEGPLALDNTVRVHNGAGDWKSAPINPMALSVVVSSSAEQGSDEVRFLFGYTTNQTGSAKLFSPLATAPSLYVSFGDQNYSVCYLTDQKETPKIAVQFKAGFNGQYTLKCNYEQSRFPSVILEDHLLNANQSMKPGTSYSFQATKQDNLNRFVLSFVSPETPSQKALPARIYEERGCLMVDLTTISTETIVRVFDIMGRSLFYQSLQTKAIHPLALHANPQILIVILQNADGVLSQKLLWKGN
jgi:hypothetical protein